LKANEIENLFSEGGAKESGREKRLNVQKTKLTQKAKEKNPKGTPRGGNEISNPPMGSVFIREPKEGRRRGACKREVNTNLTFERSTPKKKIRKGDGGSERKRGKKGRKNSSECQRSTAKRKSKKRRCNPMRSTQ